jgi:hypothetical protein
MTNCFHDVNSFMTNCFHDVNSDEELDQSKTSMIQMTDLVHDDILYSGRGNKKDTHLSDDHINIRIYNWCSWFAIICERSILYCAK